MCLGVYVYVARIRSGFSLKWPRIWASLNSLEGASLRHQWLHTACIFEFVLRLRTKRRKMSFRIDGANTGGALDTIDTPISGS